MAYNQKSDDIKGVMSGMKSPLNYGGNSALMKTGDPEKKKPVKKVDPSKTIQGKLDEKYKFYEKEYMKKMRGLSPKEGGSYTEAYKKWADKLHWEE